MLQNPSFRLRIAVAGRKKAESNFDLKRNVSVLRNYLEASVLSSAGGADENRLRIS
jgi:hypothetical protein